MTKKKKVEEIVIICEGGVITSVYSKSNANIDVTVIDLDTEIPLEVFDEKKYHCIY